MTARTDARLLNRRRVLVAGASALLAPNAEAASRPAAAALVFDALRNGVRIGAQTTDVRRQGAAVVAETHAEFIVRFGPLILFRYRHHALERWDDEGFASLETETEQNGRRLKVTAVRQAGSVSIVDAAGRRLAAPARAAPFSHWNRAIARRPLFNPQDGGIMHETVSAPEPRTFRTADGAAIATTRIVFRGDAYIEDYYDSAGDWAGLEGRLADGSTLKYLRR